MTHKDIYIKFMIEYDKANVTSSYPSLTEYEVATFLDKAYNALIAQKVTGNNPRRSAFESDIKAVSDLNPLLKTKLLLMSEKKQFNTFTKISDFDYKTIENDNSGPNYTGAVRSMPDNMRSVVMPEDMLYFISGAVPVDMHKFAGWMNNTKFGTDNPIKPIDNKDSDYANNEFKQIRMDPVRLVSHKIAESFYATAHNIPWVKNPVCYLEGGRIFLLVDPVVGIPNLTYGGQSGEYLSVTYITKPNTFVKDLQKINDYIVSHSGDEASEDTLITWKVDENIYLTMTIDRYNMSKIDEDSDFSYTNAKVGGKKIHVNDIYFYYPYKLNDTNDERFQSFPDTALDKDELTASTYYIECNVLNYNPRGITIDSIKDQTLVIGSHTVKNSGISGDDSTSLSAGGKLILACAPILHDVDTDIDINEYLDGRASKIFVVEYSDLYNILKQNGKISNENSVWSSKVSYNSSTNTFSQKASADRDPIKITSSQLYNTDNTTYTDSWHNVSTYPFEVWGNSSCTIRPSGSQQTIYVKFNESVPNSHEIQMGQSSTGSLVIDTYGDSTNMYYNLLDENQQLSESWTISQQDGGTYADGIEAGAIIALENADEPEISLSGKTYNFGDASVEAEYILDAYLGSEYTFYDIFKTVAARDQEPINMEEIAEALNISYFKYESSNEAITTEDIGLVQIDGKTIEDMYQFELDNVVAGELISLAVSYALENVESPRLNNHLQMRGLEA